MVNIIHFRWCFDGGSEDAPHAGRSEQQAKVSSATHINTPRRGRSVYTADDFDHTR